jgi:hypothetical protein
MILTPILSGVDPLILTTVVMSSLFNAYYLGDKIVEYTTKRFGMEKDSGTNDRVVTRNVVKYG